MYFRLDILSEPAKTVLTVSDFGWKMCSIYLFQALHVCSYVPWQDKIVVSHAAIDHIFDPF